MNLLRTLILSGFGFLYFVIATSASAHHSMLLYDKDQLVSIEGIVTYAKFGNPHSRFEVKVQNESIIENWVMIAQDPRDAKRFGYYDDLKSIDVGQKIKIVGWPHKRNKNELLGQNMVAPDGKIIELIPSAGYARPELYQVMDWAVADPDVYKHVIADQTDVTGADQLWAWTKSDHPIARAAVEVQRGRAKLIATSFQGDEAYPGMPKYLLCQTNGGYGIAYGAADFKSASDAELDDVDAWLKTYNRVLAKHWELVRESCGQ